MKFMKSAVMATVLAATALGATATTASARKFRPFGNSNTGNFVAGAVVAAAALQVLTAATADHQGRGQARGGQPQCPSADSFHRSPIG
mgnify:CR=1 FL=1